MRDPFVTEVIRIIRKAMPYQCEQKTVVLVSERFYDIATRESKIIHEELLGKAIDEHKRLPFWYLRSALVWPAPWLKDYEFEIRRNIHESTA